MNLQRNFNTLLGGLAVGGRELQRMSVEQAAKKEIAEQQLQREQFEKDKQTKIAGYKKQLDTLSEGLKKGHDAYIADETPGVPDPFSLRRTYGQYMRDVEDARGIYESIRDLDPTDENVKAFEDFDKLHGSAYRSLTSEIDVGETERERIAAEEQKILDNNAEFEKMMEKKQKAAQSLEAEVKGKQTQAADVRTIEQKLIDEYQDKFGF